MREPRPVPLTEAERRALRVIEEGLTQDDPALSLLMAGPLEVAERLRLRVRRLSWSYVAVTLTVLVFGVVVEDEAILGCGIVMLMITPIVVACAAEILRRWP